MPRVFFLALYFLSPALPLWLFYASAQGPLARTAMIPAVAAGTLAFVWLCWQLILVARLKFVERFCGQDALIRFHVVMGAAALGLGGIHAGLIDEQTGSGLQGGLGNVGIYVLLVMMIISALLLTDFLVRFFMPLKKARDMVLKLARLDYRVLLWGHSVLLLGIAMLLGHVMLVPGEGLLRFKAAMAAYFGLGVLALAYRVVYRRWRLAKRPWVVAAVRAEPGDVHTVELAPSKGRCFAHKPGQFLYFRPLESKLRSEEHPFTIASAPDRERGVAISVKGLGDFTRSLAKLRPGDKVAVDGPYGRFSHHHSPGEGELVFLAGGIGVTPFLSMLGSLEAESFARPARLIWGARRQGDLFRLRQLSDMAARHPGFSFHPVLSRDKEWPGLTGRVNCELLEILLAKRHACLVDDAGREREFFVCAAPSAMNALIRALKSLSVPKQRIHAERFSF